MSRPSRSVIAAALTISLPACSPQPNAADVKWAVTRTPDHKNYVLTGGATYTKGLDGWYETNVVLIDDRGCQYSFSGDTTNVPESGGKGKVASRFNTNFVLSRPIARATLSIEYHQIQYGEFDPSAGKTALYSTTQAVDPSLHPPEMPAKPCSPPLTADQKLENMPQERQVALAINSAGFLCARVTDLYPDSAGQIIAHCVKYPSGRGRAAYKIDADAGRVDQLE